MIRTTDTRFRSSINAQPGCVVARRWLCRGVHACVHLPLLMSLVDVSPPYPQAGSHGDRRVVNSIHSMPATLKLAPTLEDAMPSNS